MSRHRTAMLDERQPLAAEGSPASAAGPSSVSGPLSPSGPRSARRKRSLYRRMGIVLPATIIAVVLVAVVLVAAYLVSPKANGATSLFASIDGLSHSSSVGALEQERQTIIAMDAAAKTLTVAAKPATADPTSLAAAQATPSSPSASTPASASVGTTVVTPAAPANPTGAEEIAKAMLPAFGFDQTTQYSCLYDLWMRESGWNVYAENTASGAYGIPQSLPGDKMASAGADWQTNPATQIEWGLRYIAAQYGTPCGAWQTEVDHGYY